jgi:aminoglycoside phosphotransferase (APT) family kinase protein
MTAALQRDLPGVEIASVEVMSRDDGTNRRARLRVSYAAGSGPDVVFLKGEGAWRESHAQNGNMFNEPELFRSGVPLPVDHPHPYHVAIDRPALDYVIVMEDVTQRGADPRDATRPMTVEQVENGIRQLAALHSTYWDLSSSHLHLEWLQTWQATDGWRRALAPGVPIGTERAADVIPDRVLAIPADELIELCMRSIVTYGSGRMTLLHGDPHIGNTYLLPDNDVGFLDWQVCRRGNWSQDLAYFLVSALTVADRRASEQRLLEAYRDALALPTDEKPDGSEVWLRYAASHAYGLPVWLATHSTDHSQRPDVCRYLIERYAAAFVDSDTARALDRLGV